MYTINKYLGKFEGNHSQLLAKMIYNASLNGCDDEIGGVSEYGFWYGLLKGKKYYFIIEEDSYGFVTVDYGYPDEVMGVWEDIERDKYFM